MDASNLNQSHPSLHVWCGDGVGHELHMFSLSPVEQLVVVLRKMFDIVPPRFQPQPNFSCRMQQPFVFRRSHKLLQRDASESVMDQSNILVLFPPSHECV